MPTVLITGANGFIARNLAIYLQYHLKDKLTILTSSRTTSDAELAESIQRADFIFHLAGENRPDSEHGFTDGNVLLTKKITELCAKHKPVPILFTSSIQIGRDNPYAHSKLEAESILKEYSQRCKIPSYIYRLPNVFGKWCKPNYNSVIATFCYNVARNLPIRIDDDNTILSLVYIDDVVKSFVDTYERNSSAEPTCTYKEVTPVYNERLGDIAAMIKKFKSSPESLYVQPSAEGFSRCLSATYLSYLPVENFSYPIPEYKDERGSFYEVLKTKMNGQISVSTTKPGVTRGDHFHHSKHEKFLVIKGKARFCFRHLITGDSLELEADESNKQMIEVPTGYTHNFTNIGEDELVVLLWANEVFDKNAPDTYFAKVDE